MKHYGSIEALKPLVGESIGTSDWLVVDQHRINQFADSTGDHQWIHVDVERARSGPFGVPIAHGFLTLSLMPAFLETAFEVRGIGSALNYGLDKVRFVAPVPVNSSLRAQFRLVEWEPLGTSGAQIKVEMIVEINGQSKPACVAESIMRFFC
ncbi:MaoC family dehydratase [Paraburkholderia phytofirmans]|jgi:acyl dehydratase|uniref:MaoC family dehydratase n=1 Tax=unclassified Paraburkholderia TaxID=2615204 RepID=UPI00104C3C6D|nr:MaoC family dehydratase [Paraburkholderia sp. BL9I2N2]TCK88969.1 acyl dehydratase [Paraburkholderia sp. BL9I2N2]